ncbi:PLP-dependent aminotransferase family protein [Bradyrhizobium sp. LMTR 3]|uniref:aminotransferase-like domain-containing protein n=1 Tax=Bradyrhizobium sp. LMTR 3 TaxID=189873 RepID=UPI000A0489AB|nr:PLP-dependent aminotransferase family protein [Bradyrhizobium sp. LMTR 3]
MNIHAQQQREPISLIRTTPPTPDWMGAKLSKTLVELAERNELDRLLRYHRFGGTEADRQAGATWLAKRFAVAPSIDRILVTNGTQNALLITLVCVVGSGNLLLTENLSYYDLRRISGFLNINVKGIAMDNDGALPDAFEHACKTLNPKALFLMPTVHNPTTMIMSRERRLALADVARRYGVMIIEDDVYRFLPQEAPPSISALAPDVTWYAAGLAKCIAPGLKIAYLLPPSAGAVASAFDRFHATSTWHVAPLSASVAQSWISDGTAEKVLLAIRSEAAARQAIAARLFARATYLTKPEALHIWLTLPRRWTQSSFIAAAARAGVELRPGSMFSLDEENAPNAIRIVLGSPETRASLERALIALKPSSTNSIFHDSRPRAQVGSRRFPNWASLPTAMKLALHYAERSAPAPVRHCARRQIKGTSATPDCKPLGRKVNSEIRHLFDLASATR